MAKRAGLYLFLGAFGLFYVLPVYVMGLTSLKTTAEATLDQMWALPSSLSLESYREAWRELSPHLLNTLYLVVPGTILSALLGSLNGYVLSKWRFRGSEVLFTLLLFGLFIPYQSVLIPVVLTLQAMGLFNTIPGLILVHIVYGIPITTLIFRNFYARIPDEVIEASLVDGAGFLAAYRRVALPLSIPGFAVVGIWQFTQIWNEFIFAVTVTGSQNWPVMVALQNLSGSQIVRWNVQMSAALLAALPTLVVYIFLGRFFVRGLLAGSLKT